MTKSKILLFLVTASAAWCQTIDLVPVVSKPVSRTTELPGAIQPYLTVPLHAKVSGYLEKINVDRGSAVDRGQVLAELSAPELTAQIATAESKVQQAQSEKAQAEAQVAAAQSTYERLQKAAQTPGAVAGNEVIQSQKQVEAAQALVRSREDAVKAAQAAVDAEKDMESYLRITAPFDGVVTERLVHPGALVGPGADPVIVVLQQVSRLRVIVPVPEEDLGSIVNGTKVEFHVPAFPERAYFGTVARIAHALDEKTRTMPVELDVENRDGSLSPGMYPSIKWPVRRTRPALFVPKTAVVATTERVFVVRDRDGHAEWVDVRKGAAEGDLIEITGNLNPGDLVIKRATDEMREGSVLQPSKK